MPRPIFTTKDDFIKWLASAINPTKYDCYATASKELILIPTVSTRPVIYGHYKAFKEQDFIDAKGAVEARGIPVYSVGQFDWNIEDRVRA